MKRLLSAALLACTAPVFAAIAEVGGGSQRASGTGSGVNSVALAFPGNVTVNNLLTVGGAAYKSSGVTASISVTGCGVTWTVSSAALTSNVRVFIAYAVATSTGACTVTVDPSDATNDIGFAIDEFTGIDTSTPLDADGGNTNGGSTTPSDSLTTATANALILGVASWLSNPTCTPGGSYTQIGETESTSFQPFNFVFRIATAATAYTVNWTLSASNTWGVYTAAFKESSGGGPAPRRRQAIVMD